MSWTKIPLNCIIYLLIYHSEFLWFRQTINAKGRQNPAFSSAKVTGLFKCSLRFGSNRITKDKIRKIRMETGKKEQNCQVPLPVFMILLECHFPLFPVPDFLAKVFPAPIFLFHVSFGTCLLHSCTSQHNFTLTEHNRP